jgi:hypothetical protein
MTGALAPFSSLVLKQLNLFQIIIGTIGLTGNFVAIPILLSKRMTSIFNRMLVTSLCRIYT